LPTKPGAYSLSAETPSEPASSDTNSVVSDATIRTVASVLPWKNDRFGRS
jgi:hypothetical protein